MTQQQAETGPEFRQALAQRERVARTKLGGETRRSRSSPARGGGRARCGLPRSASGSAPPCPSTLPRAAALQTVRADSVPPTRRRRVPERGSIPDGGWASESFRLSSDPLAVQPCQAKAGWALPGAEPVPLATARATAPHSGQTALRHFSGSSWLWAEFAKCPLTLQHAHSSFPLMTFHRENPLPSTSYPQFAFDESYSLQNVSCI